MKGMSDMFKKILLCILSASFVLTTTACENKDPKEEQTAFQTFMDTAFQTAMKEDYAAAYTYMVQPTTYQISEEDITAAKNGILTDEQRDAAKKYIKQQQKELKRFSYNLLTDEQKVTYDTYKFMLENKASLLSDDYRYIPSYFSTLNGIHLQIADELTSVNITTKQQADKLIAYIASIPTYVNQVLEYTKKQQEEGTLLIDVEKVKEQCNTVIENKEKSELYTTLLNKIKQTSLSKEEKQSLEEALKKEFTQSFIPAYENIVKTMDTLSSSKDISNLSDMKKGSSYYEALFKQVTGSNESVKNTLQSLQDKLKTTKKSELVVANKNMELYENWLDNKYRTEFKTYTELMKSLYETNQEKFPAINLSAYEIKEMKEDTMGALASAQSKTFAMDATTKPIITINTTNLENQVNSLQAFVSLAQAGIPGSYYVRAYQYQNLHDNWMKVCAENLGYTQGFSTYSALYALKSLSNVNKAVIQLQQKQIQYYNYALAIADIRIHYEGATKDEIVTFLKSYGWSEKDAQIMYTTIVYNPGYYVANGVGLMKFLTLYTKAQEELGSSLNDQEFHTILLKHGTRPFSVIEDEVDAYIKQVKNNKK